MPRDTPESLPYFTKVEIGGRTMLAPGFSLVGLTGIVYIPAPNLPRGCVTVMVDWVTHGFTPENGYADGTLPPIVNVPSAHLTVIDPNAPIKEEPKPKKPKLSIVKDEPKQTEEKPAKPDDDEPDDNRPKLRLI